VVRPMLYGDGGPLDPVTARMGGDEVPLARAAVEGALHTLIVDSVIDACTPETTLVLELGSGPGYRVLGTWLAGGPEALYVGAEYTAPGRDASELLAARDPQLRFRALPFDYYAPDLTSLGRHRHAVVFTAHSVEQIPSLPASVIDAIRGVADSVTVLHFEPVGWQFNGDTPGSSIAYAERHDYNRNLVDLLLDQEAAGNIEILTSIRDVMANNPANSTSLIAWRA
jgi:hypothetical protein